jgi:geranylgeranyl diphosphate synthase type II
LNLTTETIERYLDEQRLQVDEELEKILPAAEERPPVIHRAMRYSVFAGGKRLRPILCLESGRLFGGEERNLRRLASAIELIHTYSLIHDDLPALDNDDLRRGKPTSHRVFGEATAILTGDALLTLAFQTMASPGPPREDLKLHVIRAIAEAIGTRGGMVGGQVVDLETTGKKADGTTLEYIHSAKTGALIRVAVRSGALYADASESELTRVTAYGEKVGLAFQIADDVLDVVSSKEALGKAAGKDSGQQKPTYPALYGVEKSRQIASRLAQEASETLDAFGSRAEKLKAIAQFMVARTC